MASLTPFCSSRIHQRRRLLRKLLNWKFWSSGSQNSVKKPHHWILSATLSQALCPCANPIHSGLLVAAAYTRLIRPVSRLNIYQVDIGLTNSNFSKENSGLCGLHPEDPAVGDLVHHLVLCPALQERREVLFEYWSSITASSPPWRDIIITIMSSPVQKFMQFILDCSVLPEVITATQKHGTVIYNILF